MVERRTFLKVVTGLLGGVAAAMVAIPGLGYLAAAFRRPTKKPVLLGPVKSFPLNETRLVTFNNPLAQEWDGITAKTGVFVRYLGRNEKFEEQFMVLSYHCTHLGCPVEWFPQSGLFMCPCHGGVYYEDGGHASGPPPRGLFECPWRIEQGADDTEPQLVIDAPHLPTLQNTLKEGYRARS
jgi:Rieske Fe-S protein